MKVASEAAKAQRFAGIKSILGMGKSESALGDYGKQLLVKVFAVSKDTDEAVWAILPTAAAACATQSQGV